MAINILDENTINKIAAGEVIENPASVVKELIENAIDANAKNIVIEIKDGGCQLIKITDDGDGFLKDDIELAFINHATSKIKDINDLFDINSFGFRGEALASIAAIANVNLITKSRNSKDLQGYSFSIRFGKDSGLVDAASNYGSTIEINDLFGNVPVRKKFLKSPAKEAAYINDVVTKCAISRPDIAFELYIDDKLKFSSNGNSNLEEIIYSLYGKDIYSNLVKVRDNVKGIQVNGLIAKPIVARNSKNDIIYFVNNRYIKSSIIQKAIENAYEGYLMQHKYPLVILNISISNDLVDINVHPKKLEVRFSDNDIVYYAVFNTIRNKLSSTDLIPEIKLSDDDDNYSNQLPYENTSEKVENNNSKDIDELPKLSDILKYKVNEGLNVNNFLNKLSSNTDIRINQKIEESSFIEKTFQNDSVYIGQIFKTYLLFEFDDKLYIVDQHAAHEKINFEKIMKMYSDGKTLSQKIFPSIVIRLTPLQFEEVTEHLTDFSKAGFEIELFGDNDIKVEAVPFQIINIANKELLYDMIEGFVDSKNKEQYGSIVEKIASIACKKSIKANHIVSEIEARELIKELFRLDNPYNCPHGRPTIISLTKSDFEKNFGRII